VRTDSSGSSVESSSEVGLEVNVDKTKYKLTTKSQHGN
jgi:hypothetical protein